MKLMAWAKKLDRFSLQWSEMGICMYLMVPASWNTLGSVGVTFRMYCQGKRSVRLNFRFPSH